MSFADRIPYLFQDFNFDTLDKIIIQILVDTFRIFTDHSPKNLDIAGNNASLTMVDNLENMPFSIVMASSASSFISSSLRFLATLANISTCFNAFIFRFLSKSSEDAIAFFS